MLQNILGSVFASKKRQRALMEPSTSSQRAAYELISHQVGVQRIPPSTICFRYV